MSCGRRIFAAAVVAAITCISSESLMLIAQSRTSAANPAKPWTPPRTPDGQPDLQGMWTNGTITPLERPAALAAQARLTDEEAAAQERQAAERRATANQVRRPGDIGGDNEAFVDVITKVVSTRQTSLIVDPADGRIPLRSDAEKQRDFNLTNTDSWESMSPWDRCITRGPTGMFPAGYNNGYQIVQTPGYVVIVYEMIHEARIIPLDGRPHVDQHVRSWSGDSRGHWDGITLVVDTTNFNNKGWIATHVGSGRLRGVPATEALHTVERFTPVDPATMHYSMTVDDPAVYSAPWTFSMPFTRDADYRMFEYACHEGNAAIELGLRGTRAKEAAAAKSPKTK